MDKCCAASVTACTADLTLSGTQLEKVTTLPTLFMLFLLECHLRCVGKKSYYKRFQVELWIMLYIPFVKFTSHTVYNIFCSYQHLKHYLLAKES